MLLTAFPTNLMPTPVETIQIGHGSIKRLSFSTRTNGRRRHDSGNESLVDGREGNPALVRFGPTAIPMTSGVLNVDIDYETGMSRNAVGYDAETRRYTPIDPELIPSKFANNHYFGEVMSFNNFRFNILARATGLKSDDDVLIPTVLRFNWSDEQGSLVKEQMVDRWRQDVTTDKYLALVNGVWVNTVGKEMREVATNKLVEGEFDRTTCTAYSLVNTKSARPDSKFRFFVPDPRMSGHHYRDLTINVPCNLHDPEMGIKLYKALGIKFDIYNNPTYKDGAIDPSCLMSGMEQYGAVRTKIVAFDFVKLQSLCDEWLTNNKPKTGFFGVRDHNGMISDLKSDLVALAGEEGINGKLVRRIFSNWRVRQIITALNAAIKESSKSENPEVPDDLPKAGPVFADLNSTEYEKLHADDFALLTTLLVEKEIFLPYFTPRLAEAVNSTINFALKDLRVANNYRFMVEPLSSMRFFTLGS